MRPRARDRGPRALRPAGTGRPTEWNYRADGCGTAQERLAPTLLDHLRRHGIGVLGHAFDVPGTTVADWTWRPTACGTPSGGAGLALRTFFAGLAARD